MKAVKSPYWLKLSAVLWLIFIGIPVFAQNRSERKEKPSFPNIQLRRQLRGEEGISSLGNRLPEVAGWYGKTPKELAKLLRHDRTLWVSPTGRLMYACEMEASLTAGADTTASSTRALPATASFPLDQTFKLHSLSGAKRLIYLDFVGATVSGTAWNANFNGGSDIVAAPFSLDSNPSTFSTAELQMIQNIWKRVAEDYSPFDVDVTTEAPSPDALARSSSSDLQYGNRVIITPTNFYPGAGGISYVGAFDDIGDYYKTSWVFSNMLANGEKYIAEACSHENGHSVGLHHEGTTSGIAYYQGQGDWAPIMGNSYYKNVTQWAKGEYAGANNTEDQLQVMQNYGLPYYADDHGNSQDSATLLTPGSSISGSGFIERNTDVDVFKIIAGAGSMTLNIAPAALGPNLKVRTELRDGSWNLVASSSLSTLGAAINVSVPAGTYYLAISGAGSGDPASTGYSNYASLGQYVIAGSTADPGTLAAPTAVASASIKSGEAPLIVSFSSAGSMDDTGIVSYSWDFGDGSAASSSENPSHTYTAVGNYTAILTVTDGDGLTAKASIPITVTKDIYIGSIILTSSSSSTAVSVSAAVTIRDRSGNLIPGATVVGTWSGVVTGTSSAVTNSYGVATLASPQSSSSGTFNFTVAGVSISGFSYNAALNSKTSASIAATLKSSGDTVAPTIRITYPKAGATVKNTISVQVSVSDNVGVQKVQLYVDGTLTMTSTTAPFTTIWNTSKASAGQHTLVVKAYDAAGNVGTASVTVKK